MKNLFYIFFLLFITGCSTSKSRYPVPIGFYPHFKGEGFAIDIWMDNQQLSPGAEAVIPANMDPKAQLVISNLLPEDVFMRIEVTDIIETVVTPHPNPELGRRKSARRYGVSGIDNPPIRKFRLLHGTRKTKNNHRGPDCYHRWLFFPEDLKHFKLSGSIKIFYYLAGDPEEYIHEKKFNFRIKRKTE